MEYRTPIETIIIPQPGTYFEVERDGVTYNVPTQRLEKATLSELHQYGYRRITRQTFDERYWIVQDEHSDRSVDGAESITYTLAQRFTSAELRDTLTDVYFKLAGECRIQIERNLLLWELIQPTNQNTLNWQAARDSMPALYADGVAAFQAAMALPTENEKYAALVDLHSSLNNYIPNLESLRSW